jgi:myo-inositol 2-dehydrogenase/D-chiro-inositol 1-dehydrogenase
MTSHRIGLVGAGGISHAHAPSWTSTGLPVTVWSDVGAAALAETYGLATAESFDALLEECDVIDICTPTPTHAHYVRRALEAGRAVVCEKPLARTVTDAVELARLARAGGGRLFPAHVVRYFPEYVALRDVVVAGRIGDPAVLRFSRVGQAPGSDWFFDEELSGGLILDQMLHDVDQARWIAGEVVAVSATQNPSTVDGIVPRIVTAHVVLTHRSGAVSLVRGTWGPTGTTFVTSFDVSGSRGRLRYDSAERRELTADIPQAAAGPGYLPAFSGDNPYARELRDFVEALDGGPEPRVTVDDGVIAVALAEAALDSIRRGDSIPFDERRILDLIGDPR